MAYERLGESALNYSPCRYGASKLVFRGPPQRLDGAYVAVLGGTETYGRLVERPWPALIGAATGLRMVNLGCVNAGVDAFLNDPDVLEICRGARVVVVQALGAQNMTNRFYAVHPRRNDRFLRAAPPLRALFHEVDFAEFNFTRHMLSTLQRLSPQRFASVVDELRATWLIRTRQLLHLVERPAVLLWIGADAPPPAGAPPRLDLEPLLVDRPSLEQAAQAAAACVEAVERHSERSAGAERLNDASLDPATAIGLPGAAAHADIAQALAPVLRRLV